MKIRGIGHLAPNTGEGDVRAAYDAYLAEQAEAAERAEPELEP